MSKGHNAKTRLHGIANRLEDLGACREAIEWLRKQERWSQAWQDCAEPRWLLWLLAKLARTKAGRMRVLKLANSVGKSSRESYVSLFIGPKAVNTGLHDGFDFADCLGGDIQFYTFKPNACEVIRRRFKMPSAKKIAAAAKKARKKSNG